MTIAELGSIGEFVSSIAVVISLLYLASQVKQNTAQMYRSEHNSTLEQANDIRSRLLDREMASLVVKSGKAPDEFTAEERLQYESLLAMTTWHNYNVWDRARVGALAPGQWERAGPGAARALNTILGRRWWEKNRPTFAPAFAEEMERLLAQQSGQDRD